MKSVKIGSVSIPLDSYVTTGTALLGTKGSGKTYTAKAIAEQLLDLSIPIVVFDPIGKWRWLKVPSVDKGGRGYKVVVAGGQKPDLPLTPQNATEIVRAAIRENIPLVLDFYDKRLSKADWRKIVQQCFRTLLYENEGLRHVFLEETAEFAPQKVFDGETYAEVEKLVRMGGNASLGITLINQRSQEVNKAVLDLCDNLVLLKQRGSNAIDNLQKWMDRIAPESAEKIAGELPRLKAGECWIFTADEEKPGRTRAEPIHSFHPDRTKPDAHGKAGAAADPTEFVQRLSSKLTALVAETEANDPRMLKKRIADLEAQLHSATQDPSPQEEVIDITPEVHEQGKREGYRLGFDDAKSQAERLVSSMRAEVAKLLHHALDALEMKEQIVDMKLIPEPLDIEYRYRHVEVGVEMRPNPNGTYSAKPYTKIIPPRDGVALQSTAHPINPRVKTPNKLRGLETIEIDLPLPTMHRKMLTALAQHPNGLTKKQLLTHAGYSASGKISAAFAQFKSEGWSTMNAGVMTITPEGLAVLGSFEPLPKGPALLRQVLESSKFSRMEKAILEHLAAYYPADMSKKDILACAGYSASGKVSRAFARLVRLGYVNSSGPSRLRLAEELA